MTTFHDNLPPDVIRELHAPFTSFQVRFQRRGWQRPHATNYDTEAGARNYVNRKLLGDDRPQLEPFIFIEIWRRPVGYFELYEQVLP